jgi:hypothetical protein
MDRSTPRKSVAIAAIAAGFLCLGGIARSTPDPAAPILGAMQEELDRSVTALSKADPAAYFLAITVSDRQLASVTGSNGALLSSDQNRGRWLEVQTRVGSYQLDNTHRIGDRPPNWTSPGTTATIKKKKTIEYKKKHWG